MSYWEFGKKNGLQGAPSEFEELPDGRVVTQPDAENPSVLNDDQIAYALRTSRQARHEFDSDFDALDDESKERLSTLIEQNPRQTALQKDEQKFSDEIQSKGIRSIPVRTTGPKGGKLWRN
jgi:hypothetical protein